MWVKVTFALAYGANGADLACGNWNRGSFKIVLPEAEPPICLFPLVHGDWYLPYSLGWGPTTVIEEKPTITISNKNVKVADGVFVGFDKNGYITCRFICARKNTIILDENTTAVFTYADSDVTISGYDSSKTVYPDGDSYQRTTTYSIEWKKGWNVWYRSCYTTESKGTRVTTEEWLTTPKIRGLNWFGNSMMFL